MCPVLPGEGGTVPGDVALPSPGKWRGPRGRLTAVSLCFSLGFGLSTWLSERQGASDRGSERHCHGKGAATN